MQQNWKKDQLPLNLNTSRENLLAAYAFETKHSDMQLPDSSIKCY